MKFLIFLLCSIFAVKAFDQKYNGMSDKAYLDIAVNGRVWGRVELALFGAFVPQTVANFKELCIRPEGKGYKGSRIHKVIKDFVIQGGDYENGDGTGGKSIYSYFPDENFRVKHDYEGTLSMANRGPNTAGSQFFITLDKMRGLDEKHVAFGRVLSGMVLVKEIGRFSTDETTGRPYADVIIADCGLLPLE